MKKQMEAKIWETSLSLPTYDVGQPNKNPLFLEKRVYQGSSGKIYPLPFTDRIFDEKKDKEYDVVFMENEYLQVMIMPSMGGKIYRALDKTNNYDFVYYNHVVKPSLVGLTGPWVSGGIEFNWPQHHRPSTFSPVEYKLLNNEDGSVSCIISEIDQMYGTKGQARLTLYKDASYIEIKGELYNRTEVPQTFLWWANPAVAVNDHTKSIFPPDVHAVFDHGKRDVSKFPIATGTYYKMDYSEGVDISRYKNIPVPTSYMAYHSDYNFVGGFDYGVDAGILHIANHHISPGKKQWTWGNGDFGQAWDRNLTDSDGPYIELMTGVFTDNQPDFTWLAPKEVKTFTQYFLPYKGVGQVKNASLDAIINLDIQDNLAYIYLYVPSPKHQLTLQLRQDDDIIYSKYFEELTPYESFSDSLSLNPALTEEHYELSILDSQENLLISYRPAKEEILETPDPAKAPQSPKDTSSIEELFLTGQHIEQYRHATYLPDDYYLEALKRDPKDIRSNNAYGLLMYRRGCFKTAEKHFRTAIQRLTMRNPNPYDSEPFYNLGLSLKMQGNYDQAYKAFYKSTWNGAWQNSAFFEVACIDIRHHDYNTALKHLNLSLIRNSHDMKARNLKSALLRHLGQTDSAIRWTKETLIIDPTSFSTIYEAVQLGIETKSQLINLLGQKYQNYLELSLDYSDAGLYDESIAILENYTTQFPIENHYPMIYYFLGYNYSQCGNQEKAKLAYEKAAKSNSSYCFPHRLQELVALETALIKSPKDGFAYYYLGNLYYDKRQYDRAIELWEKSLELNPTFATTSRNLALAYINKRNDTKKGLIYLEKAFNQDKTDARVLFELDQLYKKLNYSFEDRLKTFETYIDLVRQRDDLFVEYLAVLNNLGMYEKVKTLIDSRHFHPWEGGEGKVTSQYKRCRIELAKKAILNENYTSAIGLLEECKVYPPNLGEGKLINTAENDINYLLGFAYEKSGDKDTAYTHYQKASSGIDQPTDAMFYNDQPADMMFYQGLAYRKMGNIPKANSEFNRMFDYGEKHIHDHVSIDYFAVSLPDFLVFDENLDIKNKIHCQYLMALGMIGLGNYNKGQKLLDESYELNTCHQGILFHRSFPKLLLSSSYLLSPQGKGSMNIKE